MAITAPVTLEINDDDTDQGSGTPYATGTLGPSSSRPGLIYCCASRSTLSATPTLGLTGTLSLGTITHIGNVSFHTSGTPTRRGYLWWYTTGSGSGTLTFTFAANQQNLAWHVLEVPGMDTTAPIVAAIGTATNSATDITSTLDDVGGTLTWDATIGFGGLALNATLSAGGSFTNIGTTISTSPNLRTRSEYALSKQTTVNFTAGSSGNGGVLAVGLLAAAAGGGVPRAMDSYRRRRVA